MKTLDYIAITGFVISITGVIVFLWVRFKKMILDKLISKCITYYNQFASAEFTKRKDLYEVISRLEIEYEIYGTKFLETKFSDPLSIYRWKNLQTNIDWLTIRFWWKYAKLLKSIYKFLEKVHGLTNYGELKESSSKYLNRTFDDKWFLVATGYRMNSDKRIKEYYKSKPSDKINKTTLRKMKKEVIKSFDPDKIVLVYVKQDNKIQGSLRAIDWNYEWINRRWYWNIFEQKINEVYIPIYLQYKNGKLKVDDSENEHYRRVKNDFSDWENKEYLNHVKNEWIKYMPSSYYSLNEYDDICKKLKDKKYINPKIDYSENNKDMKGFTLSGEKWNRHNGIMTHKPENKGNDYE